MMSAQFIEKNGSESELNGFWLAKNEDKWAYELMCL